MCYYILYENIINLKYKIQKLHSALQTPFTLTMFRKLDVELVQFYDCFLCQIILWFKKNSNDILSSLSRRKVFSFILFPPPFGKNVNCTFYFTNSCIFHKENVVIIIVWCICTTLFIFSKSYLVICCISIVNFILR